MKVVLDTNVLISGIFFTGPPHTILKAWRNGRLQFVLTASIVNEYLRVSERLAVKYPGISIQPILELIIDGSKLVQAPPLREPVCQDPADDRFIAGAIAGEAPIIISGDRHLLNVDGYKGIRVIRPAVFVRQYLMA